MNKPKKPKVTKAKKANVAAPKQPKTPMPGQTPTKTKNLPPWLKKGAKP